MDNTATCKNLLVEKFTDTKTSEWKRVSKKKIDGGNERIFNHPKYGKVFVYYIYGEFDIRQCVENPNTPNNMKFPYIEKDDDYDDYSGDVIFSFDIDGDNNELSFYCGAEDECGCLHDAGTPQVILNVLTNLFKDLKGLDLEAAESYHDLDLNKAGMTFKEAKKLIKDRLLEAGAKEFRF